MLVIIVDLDPARDLHSSNRGVIVYNKIIGRTAENMMDFISSDEIGQMSCGIEDDGQVKTVVGDRWILEVPD